MWEINKIRVQDGVMIDKERLEALLNDGWEPFAADHVPFNNEIYYLKRRKLEEL